MGSSDTSERRFQGIAAAPGVSHGPAFPFTKGELEVPRYSVAPEKQEEEISRFEQGLLETKKQIGQIRAEVEEKVGEEEATIFDAHQLVLEDRALIEDTIEAVRESGLNIEYCYQDVANRYIEAFTQIDDEYIKERASDIRDVTRRLIFNLMGMGQSKALSGFEEEHILASDDLTPSETAMLEVEKVLGIVTEQGSRTSHSVIMARSLNIPCVVGVHDLLETLDTGDHLLVDGINGLVILNPSRQTLEEYGKIQSERLCVMQMYEADKHLNAVSTDGQPVRLLLNIEGIENDSNLLDSGTEGVGLYRTENLFMSDRGFPNEDFQYERYKRIVDLMGDYPVTIRTLDLGGDKNPHRSLTGYHEANPFMGFRAIRFCLENPDTFLDQLRAILRASAHGNVRIMYPMISSLNELLEANKLLEVAKDQLRKRKIEFNEKVQVGSMIEIPSAAVISDLLAEHCDFFSIGTNDLIQYLLAVDRVNDRIAHLYNPNQPSIMRTLNYIFEAGKEHEIPVSVCGELAGDPIYAALLLGMGASELSIGLGAVAEVKYLIRRMSFRGARKLAIEVARAKSTEEITLLLDQFHRETMGDSII